MSLLVNLAIYTKRKVIIWRFRKSMLASPDVSKMSYYGRLLVSRVGSSSLFWTPGMNQYLRRFRGWIDRIKSLVGRQGAKIYFPTREFVKIHFFVIVHGPVGGRREHKRGGDTITFPSKGIIEETIWGMIGFPKCFRFWFKPYFLSGGNMQMSANCIHGQNHKITNIALNSAIDVLKLHR